jgi:hypothetical protein
MSSITNANELRVIGMSRSGNHAIIDWLLSHMPGRTCFLNCVEGKHNPFTSARPLDDGSVFRASYRLDLATETRGRFSRKDWLVTSQEDCFLAHGCSREYEQQHDAWVGCSGRRFDLLILRDPFNLFASRRRAFGEAGTDHVSVRIWKQHARQFLGRPRNLRHQPLLVRYNDWIGEEAYRREIVETLGLEFHDEGRDRVAACAGGSSFDGRAYCGRPEDMDLLDRWKHYADDPSFRALFDEQLVAFSDEIFGVVPGTDDLLDPSLRRESGRRRAG